MEIDTDDFSDFDFGFTAVNADELNIVTATQEKAESAEKELVEVKKRLAVMRKSIQPLLDNLKKNAEKDYIYWPNRTSIIDSFEDRLDDIATLPAD